MTTVASDSTRASGRGQPVGHHHQAAPVQQLLDQVVAGGTAVDGDRIAVTDHAGGLLRDRRLLGDMDVQPELEGPLVGRRSRDRAASDPAKQASPLQPLQVLSDGDERNPKPLGKLGHADSASVLEEAHHLMLTIPVPATRHRATSFGCVREPRIWTVNAVLQARQ
jgi:hypothetical protein